jgi:hypothetical protein
MLLDVVYSINGVPIRITDERWEHIVDVRPYMASYYDRVLDTIERPTYVLRGDAGALKAVVTLARKTYLCAVYREISSNDGFMIAAYTSDKIDKGKIIWPKPKSY